MTNARPGPADIAMSPAVRSTEAKLKISEWKDASSGSDASLEENCVRWDATKRSTRDSRQRKIVLSRYSDESRR
ncbi:hypothetical protein M405DRAFT_810930 [Rhizopogon salebrosus TDB-379]|nr:hypothetical protein M405DRAFT_810930 [Rhizopogon salebrosus TDB-379]